MIALTEALLFVGLLVLGFALWRRRKRGTVWGRAIGRPFRVPRCLDHEQSHLAAQLTASDGSLLAVRYCLKCGVVFFDPLVEMAERDDRVVRLPTSREDMDVIVKDGWD